MIKDITPDYLLFDIKKIYDAWIILFTSKILSMPFICYQDYQGEDKNLLSWRSKEDYIKWWGQPPEDESYRDDGFYTRELTWLSKWCNPSVVVEIGTGHGMGSFLLDRLNSLAEIYTVDIAEYADLPNKKVEIGFFAKRNKCQIYYLKEKPDIKANFVFIDGDHSERAVWEDSLWAWDHVDKTKRWVIIWHDARQNNEEFRGLLKALNRFSAHIRKKIYKFPDSSTVWMYSEGE